MVITAKTRGITNKPRSSAEKPQRL